LRFFLSSPFSFLSSYFAIILPYCLQLACLFARVAFPLVHKMEGLSIWTDLDRLSVQLIEDGTCRIVDLVLKNLEQAENKKAAATYLYQVDCDSEWGTTQSHK